ncbi:MAG: M99 family carboxypeptidase catalytic domain-containing protein [Sulfurimonas sp.]
MYSKIKIVLLSIIIYTVSLNANIQLIKKENSDSNTTLLVVGGIHGDEPGGYFAASLLATHYKIKSKNLWIIPNLNKKSILQNKRGIHGDMNRKFSVIKKNDKDKKIVDEVKKIILSKNISLVLNLHDGHGFYRKKNQGSIFNPTAWGQTCVIDQCNLKEEQEFGNLNNIALTVKNNVNTKLIKKHHSFNVKNTKTKYDDEAMQLSLTYFAVTNNKPAFAIETSKNLSTLSQKVFYQLLAIEEFMKIMKISFIRDFDLNAKNIDKIIKNYGFLTINDNIRLNLSNIKKSLSFIPLKLLKNRFNFSNLLGNVKKVKGRYRVYIGGKMLTELRPQYFRMSESCKERFDVIVDREKISVNKASSFFVNTDFKVLKSKNSRVNIIGYQNKKYSDESNINIEFKNLNKKFSIDKSNKVYRIEFYNKNEFCFMSMVKFN